MSKKMLKRSLALGALMAFVITGQAWAETKVLSKDEIVTSKIDYSSDYKDVDLSGYILTVDVSDDNWAVDNPSGLSIIDSSSGKTGTLKIITTGTGLGALNGGTVDVGSLIINSNNNALSMVDGNGSSTLNITANVVKLSHIDDNTNAIFVDGCTLNIGSQDKKIGVFNINGNNNEFGRAIRQTDGGNVNIYAKELNVSGYKEEIKLDKGSALTLNADKGQITSDIIAGTDSKGTVNMTLGSGVDWEGNITTGESDSCSQITLNGATWNNNGASNVTLLTMKDGIINQESDNDIVIKEYTGSGTANFEANGKILIDKAASSASLSLASEKDTPENIVTKLGVGKDAKDLKANITRAAGAVTGDTTWAVDYEQTDNDNDGYFIAKLGEKSESVNPVNESIAEMHSIALMAWRAENNDMHKRLGELRDANGEHGAWARMTRGESEYESVKNQYNAYQLGYDQKAGDWTVGAAVTYTEGETSFAEGNGENDHTGLAVYGSKLNGDGSYLDLIAKYAKLDHEYTVSGGIGSGEYDTDGFALSAEYGKRFEQGNGLWIEPQVELTYGLVDSVGFAAENGRVSLDDMNSLVGRVGFRAGKDVKDGNVYVRASYLYDFEGETDIAFTDGVDTRSFKQDLGGGWWEFGIGTNINLSKATYIYADVEHACGGEVDTDWKWNLGVRYSF